jgi:hypothetical protein
LQSLVPAYVTVLLPNWSRQVGVDSSLNNVVHRELESYSTAHRIWTLPSTCKSWSDDFKFFFATRQLLLCFHHLHKYSPCPALHKFDFKPYLIHHRIYQAKKKKPSQGQTKSSPSTFRALMLFPHQSGVLYVALIYIWVL